ncbi:MAG TPA: carboxypeptidase-like regulatory domain-containing protein, partial [Flavobacterium sp.]|nr:carboxypeptidase-like regulatory domain-containing protein [Flavobacterium sp.]
MRQSFWLLLLVSFVSQAQFHLNGIVKDADTKKPLPFASINSNTGSYTITDVDGKFSIDSNTAMTSFTVSYIGFSKMEIPIDNRKFYNVLLAPKPDELGEVTVSGASPALAIIRKTINSKSNNNPQKKLASFQFKAYNKLIITANPDSIDGRIDTT